MRGNVVLAAVLATVSHPFVIMGFRVTRSISDLNRYMLLYREFV
ncbi:hypothetical protein PCI56_26535 [Plesiomonas shigelloides subsp. oncorhynchi]|nr:hypothetical protein [Plesiomonas shigelloides]